MIKAHDLQQAQWTQRPGETWPTCDYCGSIHPETLTLLLQQGAKLSGADWKYGWPHKFYVQAINPEPERLYVNSSCNFKPADSNYVLEKGHWVLYGTRPFLHAKWYNDHLQDDDIPEELWDLIAEYSRIRFRLRDGQLSFAAPWHGFQYYDGMENPPEVPLWKD